MPSMMKWRSERFIKLQRKNLNLYKISAVCRTCTCIPLFWIKYIAKLNYSNSLLYLGVPITIFFLCSVIKRLRAYIRAFNRYKNEHCEIQIYSKLIQLCVHNTSVYNLIKRITSNYADILISFSRKNAYMRCTRL